MISDTSRQSPVAAHNMRPQSLSCLGQGAFPQRRDDVVMFGDDAIDILHPLPMQQLRDAFVVTEAPIRIHHQRVSCQPDQKLMEVRVLVDEIGEVLECLSIMAMADGVIDGDKLTQDLVVNIVDTDIKRTKFENYSGLKEVGNFLGIGGWRNPEPLVWLVNDQALCREPSQGLANGNDAGAEFSGKVGQVDLFALTHFPDHDPSIDLIMCKTGQIGFAQDRSDILGMSLSQ